MQADQKEPGQLFLRRGHYLQRKLPREGELQQMYSVLHKRTKREKGGLKSPPFLSAVSCMSERRGDLVLQRFYSQNSLVPVAWHSAPRSSIMDV